MSHFYNSEIEHRQMSAGIEHTE